MAKKRIRQAMGIRLDADVHKQAEVWANEFGLSIGRMSELLLRWFFDPDNLRRFINQLDAYEKNVRSLREEIERTVPDKPKK